MFLIHNTRLEYLKLILKEGELKSSKLTGNINEGDGIYDSNKYVYFHTTDKIFDKGVIGQITLYFTSDFLYNRSYLISTYISSSPNNGYKRKINRYSKNYNKILLDLYNHSLLPKVFLDKSKKHIFFQFHQIAILNKVNITKSLIGIHFFIRPSEGIIKYIKKYYPNVEIKIN
jgi:hypothetical protein